MKAVVLILKDKRYKESLKTFLKQLGYFVVGNLYSYKHLVASKVLKKSQVAIVEHSIKEEGDGVNYLELLKELNSDIKIIYIVKSIEQLEEASFLKIKPQRVFLKPIDRNELKIALKMIFSEVA